MKIELTTAPSDTDAQRLRDGIRQFNHTAVPALESEEAETRFFVLMRDDVGTVQGGLRATCYWNTLHIELLWVGESCRGTGAGTILLLQAETKAQSLGCEKALVETTSWQAKPFYERHGYSLIATLKDRPKGHSSHYLSKTLSPVDTA